jgi:two-component system, LytTR family, response regulator
MSLSCYIVDDESHAIRILADYIQKTPGLSLAGSSTEPLQALAELSAGDPPDILFLDVDMPELNGLDLAGLAGGRSAVVFTTAYREYAVDAFEKRAADYLVKPVFYERFLACVQELRKRSFRPDSADALFVTTGTRGKLLRVLTEDIRYIEGADSYVHIISKNEKVMTYMTLSEVLRRLPQERFSRVHKSYIVQDRVVRIIEPGQLKLEDGTVLPLGPSYRAAFYQKMGVAPSA